MQIPPEVLRFSFTVVFTTLEFLKHRCIEMTNNYLFLLIRYLFMLYLFKLHNYNANITSVSQIYSLFFFFFCRNMQQLDVGSWFPDQGLNLGCSRERATSSALGHQGAPKPDGSWSVHKHLGGAKACRRVGEGPPTCGLP